MKILLSLILLVLSPVTLAVAQKPARSPAKPVENFILKRQIFVDDIESQLSTVQYAAVRVSIRYRLATWLWKNGKDDTGRAEGVAVSAVDELYNKKDEIPSANLSSLSKDLFALLEKNAPAAGARLKKKHSVEAEDEGVYGAYDKIGKPGGDKEAAQAIIKSLSVEDEFDDGITIVLAKLASIESPQMPVVLGAVVEAFESGRVQYDFNSLKLLFPYFMYSSVPYQYQRRFFVLVLSEAREALRRIQTVESVAHYDLLGDLIDGFGKIWPDLATEAAIIRSTLAARSSRADAARREADERIAEAADKLSATIDEAEKAENDRQKRDFYIRAVILAITEEKFPAAINIIGKIRELDGENSLSLWTDIYLESISQKALENDDPVSAGKATADIRDGVRRAEMWKRAALYFDSKKDALNSRDALDKAIKLLSEENKENPLRIFALVRAIPDVQKIDRARLTEVIVLTSKAVNDLPTLGIDDKPGTGNYQRYIASVFIVNRNIDSAMPKLLKENRIEAEDLAGRLQKKEFRVFADMLIGIDALETAQKEAEKKAAAEKKPATAKPQ